METNCYKVVSRLMCSLAILNPILWSWKAKSEAARYGEIGESQSAGKQVRLFIPTHVELT